MNNSGQIIVIVTQDLVVTLILYILMDSSFLVDIINLGWSIVYIEGRHVINANNCISSLKIFLSQQTLNAASWADPEGDRGPDPQPLKNHKI